MFAVPNSSSLCSSVPSWSYLWSAMSWSQAAVIASSMRWPDSSLKSCSTMYLVISATAFMCACPCDSSLSVHVFLTKSERRFQRAWMASGVV